MLSRLKRKKLLKQWLATESQRRSGLEPKDFCQNYLISYPRSGSHAVRFMLEFVAHRTTLGGDDHESFLSPKGYHDLPVFLRSSSIQIKNPSLGPVAIKRHEVKPIDMMKFAVLVSRDPVEAILSHLRHLRLPGRSDLEMEIRRWENLASAFMSIDPEARHVVYFEEIFSKEETWVVNLLRFLGVQFSAEDLQRYLARRDESKSVLQRRARTQSLDFYRQRQPGIAQELDQLLSESLVYKSAGPLVVRKTVSTQTFRECKES